MSSELEKSLVDERTQKEVVEASYDGVQGDLEELEEAARAACREVERAEGVSGSSLVSRLASLGRVAASRERAALGLGVLKALAVASTHYLIDFEALASGYVVDEGADDEAAAAVMDQADAAAAEPASRLAALFEGELSPGADDGEDDVGGSSPAAP